MREEERAGSGKETNDARYGKVQLLWSLLLILNLTWIRGFRINEKEDAVVP